MAGRCEMKHLMILILLTQAVAAASYTRVPLKKIFTYFSGETEKRTFSFALGRSRIHIDEILQEAMARGNVRHIITTDRISVQWKLPYEVSSHRILQFMRKVTGSPDPKYRF